MRRVNVGDWLLNIFPESDLTELSIFALVLDSRKTFTKIARWQAFGRLKLSDAVLPTVFVKKYYKKIGELSIDRDLINDIRMMLSDIPERSLNNQNRVIFNYDKALYNNSKDKKALETLLYERDEKRDTFEVELLKCFENINPKSEECKSFLLDIVKEVEKIYESNGYTIYRSIQGNIKDVIKNK